MREDQETDHILTGAVAVILLVAFLCVLWANELLSPSLLALSLGIGAVCWRRRVRVSSVLAIETTILVGSWLLHEIAGLLMPFAVAFVLAYLLNPLVARLNRKMPLGLSIGIVAFAGLCAVVGGALLVAPVLARQVSVLAERLPGYREAVAQWVSQFPYSPLGQALGKDLQHEIAGNLPSVGQNLLERLLATSQKAIGGAASAVSQLLNLIVIPFATFYLLKDYGRLTGWLMSLIPVGHHEISRTLVTKSNAVLGKYLRGQAIVCMFVSAATAVGLAIAGVDYSAVLGVMTGLLNLVPYVGITVAFVVSALVAVLGASPLWAVAKVGIVFAIVQTLDGNIVSPKVVGEQVGLHPLLMMFSVLFFAHFWGIMGMIVAVPLSAVANVVVRGFYGDENTVC